MMNNIDHSEYIVEMRNITKKFPGIVANDNVSFGIKKGEIYAFLGENGAGKSTLMSVLFGMYEPDAGEIYIRGEKVRITSPYHANKLNIGMVHQHFKLVSNYTVTENIVLGMEPVKRAGGILPVVDIKGTNKKIAELSIKYGLEIDPTKKIEELPVAIQQRVEILKMLYREAEIMIFDEPTAMLTPQEIVSLLQIIKELRNAGKTIILITHKLEEIKQVADRCAILCHGKLVDVCDVATTSTARMAYLMVGREIETDIQKNPAKYGETVLEVKNLTVHNSDKFPVVKDVSFKIRSGEILAIAGVSGNGQDELADAIAGLASVAEGSVVFKGRDITNASVRDRNMSGMAYIPADRQTYGLILDFNLRDNLMLKNYYQEPYCVKGFLHKDKFAEFASDLLGNYDIRCGQGIDTIVRSMSGGNQQKAIVAREIKQDADLIIFVQPTRGMDIGAIDNIHKQILAERDAGKAVLLISLELEEVMTLADTIGVMFSGELLKIADAKDLSVNEIGNYMMGVTTV